MSEEEKKTPDVPEHHDEDDKGTFDIYHFKSKWDMVLIALFIMVLMAIAVFLVYSTGAHAG